MPERYDYSQMKYFEETKNTSTVIKKGSKWVYISKLTNVGAYMKEYSIDPDFYAVQKKFYPNGNLASRGTFIDGGVRVGIWQYFDENEKLIKEVDEDARFGKIKPDHILKFLEKEGWINLKTGKGRSEIVFDRSGRGSVKKGIFELYFLKRGEDPVEYPDHSLWSIIIEEDATDPSYYIKETIYIIHGETGKVLRKTVEKKQHPPI